MSPLREARAANDVTPPEKFFGFQLGADKKSLAYNLTFRSPDRNLTNEEVDRSIDAIVKHVESALNGQIR